jgi:hypothetical protein
MYAGHAALLAKAPIRANDGRRITENNNRMFRGTYGTFSESAHPRLKP